MNKLVKRGTLIIKLLEAPRQTSIKELLCGSGSEGIIITSYEKRRVFCGSEHPVKEVHRNVLNTAIPETWGDLVQRTLRLSNIINERFSQVPEVWFCGSLTWNPFGSLVCDVSWQLNVLYHATSCFGHCNIWNTATHSLTECAAQRQPRVSVGTIFDISQYICLKQSTPKFAEKCSTAHDRFRHSWASSPPSFRQTYVLIDLQMGVFFEIGPIWVQVEHKVDGNSGTAPT
ncbi:hypothetical protein T265_01659 [Opisthorchis viverrini]|uniref:Uncharacterized protein n=1 Tax=Opisthorchis viverrini TaxID=6198 RepID=A0A074ZYU2_OPIVI|nr:hypothetical protein T265_01659 [Opisthorchis viverrini]KER32226.1 hypothetical protein T265_01659 [Opisthorchis viverrini]